MIQAMSYGLMNRNVNGATNAKRANVKRARRIRGIMPTCALDPNRTAILLIEYQNEFTTEGMMFICDEGANIFF